MLLDTFLFYFFIVKGKLVKYDHSHSFSLILSHLVHHYHKLSLLSNVIFLKSCLHSSFKIDCVQCFTVCHVILRIICILLFSLGICSFPSLAHCFSIA